MADVRGPDRNLPVGILVLCSGNACRSIFAEALFNTYAEGRLRAFSAGLAPSGQLDAQALDLMHRRGVPSVEIRSARSKCVTEFLRPGAPAIDHVLTVCNDAAQSALPLLPNAPSVAHWHLPSGSDGQATGATGQGELDAVWEALDRRIRLFVTLPLSVMTGADLARAAQRIDAAATD